VENKSSKDLKEFLSNLVEQTVIPFVIILDNLHNIANISETFNEFFNFKNTRKIEYDPFLAFFFSKHLKNISFIQDAL
jgi:hypothetical protein